MERKILIVDDEAEIRDMLSRHFRFLKYKVTTAENGAKGLEALSKEVIRVVISDITMPEVDGIALLREIRSQYPMTRVIMITGAVNLDSAMACMRNQADTCIFKPLQDLSELDKAVEGAFEHLEHWEEIFLELKNIEPIETSPCASS